MERKKLGLMDALKVAGAITLGSLAGCAGSKTMGVEAQKTIPSICGNMEKMVVDGDTLNVLYANVDDSFISKFGGRFYMNQNDEVDKYGESIGKTIIGSGYADGGAIKLEDSLTEAFQDARENFCMNRRSMWGVDNDKVKYFIPKNIKDNFDNLKENGSLSYVACSGKGIVQMIIYASESEVNKLGKINLDESYETLFEN